MIIYRCDRCGKEIPEHDLWHLDLRLLKEPIYMIGEESEQFDICEDCAADVSEFMKEPKKIRTQTINRLNAFQKAFEEMKGEEDGSINSSDSY